MNINQQIAAQVARKEHDKEEARRNRQKEEFDKAFMRYKSRKRMKEQQYDF